MYALYFPFFLLFPLHIACMTAMCFSSVKCSNVRNFHRHLVTLDGILLLSSLFAEHGEEQYGQMWKGGKIGESEDNSERGISHPSLQLHMYEFKRVKYSTS